MTDTFKTTVSTLETLIEIFEKRGCFDTTVHYLTVALQCVEKQIAKKPIKSGNGHKCICGAYIDGRDWHSAYCGCCGQKLDWSEV